MKITKVLVLLATISIHNSVVFAWQADSNGKSYDYFKQALAMWPSADLNNDGELTWTEADQVWESGASWQGVTYKATNTNIQYGESPQCQLDFYKAQSDKPTPVLVYIHGGGFRWGNRNELSGDIVKRCLDNGVSVATIDYRTLRETSLQNIMRDGARAVQYLRANAQTYNLDKSRFVACGTSAGAGISIWLAVHDNIADQGNADPVLKESSRIAAAGAIAPQFSYDFLKWHDIIGENVWWNRDTERTALGMYRLPSPDALHGEQGQTIRADLDLVGLMDKNDAPIFLYCDRFNRPVNSYSDYVHQPKHSRILKEQADKVGLRAEFFNAMQPPVPKWLAHEKMLDFFFGVLGIK